MNGLRVSIAVFFLLASMLTATAAHAQVAPAITQNPTDVTINAGQTAIFTAAASGTPAPTVQWQFSTNGGATFNNVAGATNTTLTVPNVTAGQNGTKFRAVFTNSTSSATTTAATMTVNFAPSVTTNPTSQTIAAGSTVSFTAAASGNPTPTVQWQQSINGGGTFTNIAGATSTPLMFTALVAQNGNQYRAVFNNTVGTATTTAATLSVTQAPAITQNPTDVTVNAGQTAIFTAAASGAPAPTVQWQFSTNGGATFNNVAGATTTTLTVPNVTAGQNGIKFRAVFTNSTSTATTTAATMTVNFAPSVTTNPTSQTFAAGSTASFTAAASGNPTPTVQWQLSTNGGGTFTNIVGATSTPLMFATFVAQTGNQYRAVFNNTVGTATTTAATLTVTPVNLSLAIDDGFAFARYGTTIDYIVALDNTGAAALSNLSVTSTLSPALNSAGAHFSCALAGGGATCPANGSGALAATIPSLPAGGSLTWIASVPVATTTAQTSVTMSVSATGTATASASDTDTLVLLRDGFEAASEQARISASPSFGEKRDEN
jgi:Immunoglobulin I-set domain